MRQQRIYKDQEKNNNSNNNQIHFVNNELAALLQTRNGEKTSSVSFFMLFCLSSYYLSVISPDGNIMLVCGYGNRKEMGESVQKTEDGFLYVFDDETGSVTSTFLKRLENNKRQHLGKT